MSNMSYCRFQNTSSDFQDCLDNIRSLDPADYHPNTESERRCRADLIRAAAELLQEIGLEDLDDELELEACIEKLEGEYEEENED